MTRTALIVGLAGSLLASGAHAQFSLSSVDRYVLVAAEGGVLTDGPTQVDGPVSGPWNGDEFASATQGGNGGSANGYQVSEIGAGVYSGYVDASASAFGDGSDFASGYGQSHFEMDINVTAPSDWMLEGYVNAFGDINGEISEAYIELVNIDTNTVIWSTMVDNAYEEFNEAGTLAPGNYRFEADALAIVDRIFENGFGDSTATVDFDFTIVPTPASASLLALGVLGCAGRRRR